jgi:hypothetical protein
MNASTVAVALMLAVLLQRRESLLPVRTWMLLGLAAGSPIG